MKTFQTEMLGHSVESHNRIAESKCSFRIYISIEYLIDALLSNALRDMMKGESIIANLYDRT